MKPRLSFKNFKLVALQRLIIFSNKSFITNISLGWNVIFGANSNFIYIIPRNLIHIIPRKKNFFFNNTKYSIIFPFYIIPRISFFNNNIKYSIIFHFYIIPRKKEFLIIQNSQ